MMEHNHCAPDDETKVEMEKIANRQALITGGAVTFGMGIAQAVAEGMTGQQGWLRALAAGVAAGVGTVCSWFLLSKLLRGPTRQ
jgi:NAD(P)-dependent dehydrogenase (short-subunit alcohol dehydrogenase family)